MEEELESAGNLFRFECVEKLWYLKDKFNGEGEMDSAVHDRVLLE